MIFNVELSIYAFVGIIMLIGWGLLYSQPLTLYVTPVFYVYMQALRRRLSRHAVPE